VAAESKDGGIASAELREAIRERRKVVIVDVPVSAEVVTVCARGGARSEHAAGVLRANGRSAQKLSGGVASWTEPNDDNG
jgi:rhodanese-related sulfurtransferase